MGGPREVEKVCRVQPWPTNKISTLQRLAPIGNFSIKNVIQGPIEALHMVQAEASQEGLEMHPGPFPGPNSGLKNASKNFDVSPLKFLIRHPFEAFLELEAQK